MTFTATGVECRAWDVPIGGRIQRDADQPNVVTANVQTDLPVRFNPSDGRGGVLPNCSPDDHDVDYDQPHIAYPVFLEEHLERATDLRTAWTVSKAVRDPLSTQNDERFILNPNMDDLTAALVVKVPVSDDGTMDPNDSTTYKVQEMPLRDYDASNKAWPDALEELLGMVGSGSTSRWSPTMLRRRAWPCSARIRASRTAQLLLDDFGSAIDPARNDVTQLALARRQPDRQRLECRDAPRRWEASIVLACGFSPASGDETASNRPQFLKSRLADTTETIQRKYRWYVADKAADGHWNGESSTWRTPTPST